MIYSIETLVSLLSFSVYSELIKVHQELFHFHPTYNIISARYHDFNQSLAVVQKKFSFLFQNFQIDSVYGHYTLTGLDTPIHSYILTKDGKLVARVNKKYFVFTDTYNVDVAGNEDQAFILALIIVLDQVLYNNKR